MDRYVFPSESLLLLLAAAPIVAYLYTVYPTGELNASDRKLLINEPKDAEHILKHSKLSDRAIPNQRLVKAFGIHNAFTTTNGNICTPFVIDVTKKLRMKDSDWEAIAKDALGYIEGLKTRIQGTGTTLTLEVLTQNFVFKIVMRHFYPAVPEISDSDVEFITSSVNNLWTASKSCSSPTTTQKNELLRRITHIFDISPNLNPDGDSRNPLNIILPAYETLWRVVLRCFLEVQFRSISQQNHLRDSLTEFLSNPTQTTFVEGSEEKVSVKAVVLEALRLYPPTKRIHRFSNSIEPAFEGSWSHILRFIAGSFGFELGEAANPKVDYAIDVEHLHRDPQIWGQDALEFIPARTENAKHIGFMPFGARPFICPAGNSFAPMMIGICVGAMIEAFQIDTPLASSDKCENWKLVDIDGVEYDLAKVDGPLDNGREGLRGLYLAKY
jgi:hypothetical protein